LISGSFARRIAANENASGEVNVFPASSLHGTGSFRVLRNTAWVSKTAATASSVSREAKVQTPR
jgi:hypothetical protein